MLDARLLESQSPNATVIPVNGPTGLLGANQTPWDEQKLSNAGIIGGSEMSSTILDANYLAAGEPSPLLSPSSRNVASISLTPSNSATDSLTGQILQKSLDATQTYLTQFANSLNFAQDLKTAFGDNIDIELAQRAVQEIASEGAATIPPIQILPSSEINGANGAFDSVNGTIYLSKEFMAKNASSPQTIAKVLLEEIGHAIDSKINTVDAPGDEGEIFANLATGKQLTQTELLALKSEDDRATVFLNGKWLTIEQATPSTFGINLNSIYYNRNGNKFVASNGTGGTYLWCTDFAFGRALEKGLIQNYSGLGGQISGNAGAWDDQAGSWGRQARANSFVVWDPNQGGAGSVGHVGFVEQVNADGSFVISEANFAQARMSFNSRTISPGTPAFNTAKFVYLSGAPQSNSNVGSGISPFRGVLDGTVNIRSGPGTNNGVVGSLTPGSSRNFDAVLRGTTHWDAREQRNDDRWFRIQGTNQWVSAAFVTGNPLFNGITDATLNVRSGPGTNFPVVGSLSVGSSQTFDATTVGTTHWDAREAKNENRWFRLQGTDRWVSAAFITGNPTY